VIPRRGGLPEHALPAFGPKTPAAANAQQLAIGGGGKRKQVAAVAPPPLSRQRPSPWASLLPVGDPVTPRTAQQLTHRAPSTSSASSSASAAGSSSMAIDLVTPARQPSNSLSLPRRVERRLNDKSDGLGAYVRTKFPRWIENTLAGQGAALDDTARVDAAVAMIYDASGARSRE
jgi:hypothetical protein